MKLHGNVKILSLYMDGQLDKKLAEALASHLKDCRECRETLAGLQETRNLIAATAPVEAPATLEREIMDNLPETRTFLLPLKKFYLPAMGMLAVLIVASLLILQNLKEEHELQIAKAPGHEEPAAVSEDTDAKKQREDKETPRPILPEKAKTEKMHPSQRTTLAEPSLEKTLSDELGADKPKVAEGILTAGKGREEEKTYLARERAAKAPPAAMKSAAENESLHMDMAYRKPLLNAIVIRNEDEWKTIWHTQNTVQNLSLPLPDVDFKEKMVVALPSRIEDREYVVVNTTEEKDKIIVEYKEQPLQKSAPPPYQLNVVNQKPVVELQKIE